MSQAASGAFELESRCLGAETTFAGINIKGYRRSFNSLDTQSELVFTKVRVHGISAAEEHKLRALLNRCNEQDSGNAESECNRHAAQIIQ